MGLCYIIIAPLCSSCQCTRPRLLDLIDTFGRGGGEWRDNQSSKLQILLKLILTWYDWYNFDKHPQTVAWNFFKIQFNLAYSNEFKPNSWIAYCISTWWASGLTSEDEFIKLFSFMCHFLIFNLSCIWDYNKLATELLRKYGLSIHDDCICTFALYLLSLGCRAF